MKTTTRRSRGIPFSPPMVKAERAGLKTITRRCIKGVDGLDVKQWHCDGDGLWHFQNHRGEDLRKPMPCPYGEPGDLLWVKEALARGMQQAICYVADGELVSQKDWPWKPNKLASMYCPRWASRRTLEIQEIRIERVQDISEADAQAEGMERVSHVGPCRAFGWKEYGGRDIGFFKAKDSFRSLWEVLNKSRGYGWESNPLVWVVVFKRLEDSRN